MLFLFMLLIPIWTAESKPLPITTFIILVTCAIIFYQPFIEKFKSEKVGLLLIPIIALIGISLGFSFFFSLLLAAIIFWRVLYHVKDNDPNEMMLLIATFIVGVVFYLYFFYTETNHVFLMITIVQFFLVTALKMIKLYFQSEKSVSDRWNQIKWQLGGLAALGGITVISILSYDVIRLVITFIFRQIFFVISFLFVPFVYLASLLNIQPKKRGQQEEGGLLNDGEWQRLLDEATTKNLDFMVWVVGIIAFLVILYLIFRKSGTFTLREYMNFNDKEEGTQGTQNLPRSSWFSSSRPKNEIRRLFYDFEKFMAKQGEGRLHNETVEDWFARVNLNSEYKDIIVTTYENVRYGENEVTKAEKSQFTRTLKELKKAIKKGV